MIRLVTLLLVAMSLPACGSSRWASSEPSVTILAQQEDLAFMRKSIIDSMKRRRFTPIVDEPGRLVGHHERGDITFDVEVLYTATRYDVTYLDLGTLETETSDEGDVLVDDRYRAALVRHISKHMKNTHKRARQAKRKAAQNKARARAAWSAEEHRRQLELERARNPQTVIVPQEQPQQAAPAPSAGDVINTIGGMLPPVKVGGSYESNTRRSEQSLTCCINGSKYLCPGQAAFEQCVTTDPSACTPAGGC